MDKEENTAIHILQSLMALIYVRMTYDHTAKKVSTNVMNQSLIFKSSRYLSAKNDKEIDGLPSVINIL